MGKGRISSLNCHGKDLSSRYVKFENPALVRRRSEKMQFEFQEKHKKLAAAFNRSRSKSSPPTPGASSQQQNDSSKMEDTVFKDIESLNNEKTEIHKTEEEEN